MTLPWSPLRWANSITKMLNAVYGTAPERFPVNVTLVAKEYSHQRFPDDPITLVKGAPLPGAPFFCPIQNFSSDSFKIGILEFWMQL